MRRENEIKLVPHVKKQRYRLFICSCRVLQTLLKAHFTYIVSINTAAKQRFRVRRFLVEFEEGVVTLTHK